MAPPSAISYDIEGVTDTEVIVLPDPLTVNGVASRRAKAGKLVAGTAASTSSNFFKSSVRFPSYPIRVVLIFCSPLESQRRRDGTVSQAIPHFCTPLTYADYISIESKSRQPSSLKGAAKYLNTPGLISLGGGLPLAENFPIEEISIKVPTPPHFKEKPAAETGTTLSAGKYDVVEGKSVYDLAIALNYSLGTGSAQMVRWITEHTEIVCNPPYADWQCVLTVGSTSALDHAFRMLCERGDYVLAEEYTFSSAVETGLPLGVKFLGIKMDDQGLIPEIMDEILSKWDVKARGARKPFVLYTVPSGQNPTGATQGVARRRAIYRVAQKHDVYILEDEPYYFLQMQPYTGPNAPDVPPSASNEEFLRSLVPTFLSMDIDGRVMRMDSFSKVIAPGTRCGWITASEQIIERFVRANETSVQNPSGISQMVLFKMLDEHWGHGGYLQWLISLRMEYTSRRDVLLAACEKYLPRELVSWNPPAAGMFVSLA
jgi:aromatic amino acid aminotransferase I / 2-aminoadipate transaminase